MDKKSKRESQKFKSKDSSEVVRFGKNLNAYQSSKEENGRSLSETSSLNRLKHIKMLRNKSRLSPLLWVMLFFITPSLILPFRKVSKSKTQLEILRFRVLQKRKETREGQLITLPLTREV